MPPRRRPAGSGRRDDVTGQAGWMYTDLLLGLMVVFMATVSFIPEASLTKKPSAYVYTQRFDQVFEQVYVIENSDSTLINQEVTAFLLLNNLPEQSVIVQAQFVGGFNANVETPTDGINRAVGFSAKVDAGDPEILSKAATSVDASGQIDPGEIVVRLRFAALVK